MRPLAQPRPRNSPGRSPNGQVRLTELAGTLESPTLSPSHAAHVTPNQLQEIAAGTEKTDPSIFDKIGAYYAQHPKVVKVLGGAAAAIGLGQMANRIKR